MDDALAGLLEAYLDGELDLLGLMALEALLRDPEIRREARRQVSLHLAAVAALTAEDAVTVAWGQCRTTLSASRQLRIDAAIGRKLRGGRGIWRSWHLLAVAAALLLAAVWWIVPWGRAVGSVEHVLVADGPGARCHRLWWDQGLGEGSTIRAGDGLDIPPGQGLAIVLVDGSRLQVSGGSRLGIGVSTGTDLALASGAIQAQVVHQSHGPMRIATGDAAAQVVGTRLYVAADPGGTILTVDEGLVRLTRHADAVEVPGGGYALARTTGTLAVRDLADLAQDPAIRLPWRPAARGRPATLGDGGSTPDGHPAERVEFHVRNPAESATVFLPCRIRPGDRAFSVLLRLEQAGPEAGCDVRLLDRHGDAWWIGCQRLACFGQGWRRYTCRLANPAVPDLRVGDGPFDPAMVCMVEFTIGQGDVRLLLADARFDPDGH